MTDKNKSLSEKRAEAGRKGGQARVAKGLSKMSAKRRSEIASKGGNAKWGNKDEG